MTPFRFKLGKKPASPLPKGAVRYSLLKQVSEVPLPPVPDRFGFTRLSSGRPWGMLGNDTVGDCVIAGACHSLMLQAERAGKIINFTDASAIQTYSDATGYDPNDPSTDQGTDMVAFGDFWKNTGILDDSGNRHKIVEWIALDTITLPELREALWVFKAVMLGMQFPQSAMDQFNNNEVWSSPISSIEGGHCIMQASRYTWDNIVTWNQPHAATEDFLLRTLDEAFIPITQEMLDDSGKNEAGYDLATLIQLAKQIAP
jgi:hypothetical protein